MKRNVFVFASGLAVVLLLLGALPGHSIPPPCSCEYCLEDPAQYCGIFGMGIPCWRFIDWYGCFGFAQAPAGGDLVACQGGVESQEAQFLQTLAATPVPANAASEVAGSAVRMGVE